jgi:hypothetical protein
MRQTYTLHINEYQMIFYSVYDLVVMINNLDNERKGCLKGAYVTCNTEKSKRYNAEDYIK